MIEKLSEPGRTFFLIKIIEELMLHSKGQELIELERRLSFEKEEKIRKKEREEQRLKTLKKTLIDQKKKRYSKEKLFSSRLTFPTQRTSPIRANFIPLTSPAQTAGPSGFAPSISTPIRTPPPRQIRRPTPIRNQKGRIPDVVLPPQFRYLQPTQTGETLDLGKLNPLLANPRIREIECDGPDTEIIVRGIPETRTNIFLTNEEIQHVFMSFSEAAKIPIYEEIIKITAGGLILNGINSNVVGSRFIIKRVQNRPPQRMY